jgi:hypothetical protein
MVLRCIFLVKIIIEINYFWMFYALCNKIHNFGTCKDHGTRQDYSCVWMSVRTTCPSYLHDRPHVRLTRKYLNIFEHIQGISKEYLENMSSMSDA